MEHGMTLNRYTSLWFISSMVMCHYVEHTRGYKYFVRCRVSFFSRYNSSCPVSSHRRPLRTHWTICKHFVQEHLTRLFFPEASRQQREFHIPVSISSLVCSSFPRTSRMQCTYTLGLDFLGEVSISQRSFFYTLRTLENILGFCLAIRGLILHNLVINLASPSLKRPSHVSFINEDTNSPNCQQRSHQPT